MAGRKTYIPGLTKALTFLWNYGNRWDDKLSVSLTPEQYSCFRDVMTAVGSCLVLLVGGTP